MSGMSLSAALPETIGQPTDFTGPGLVDVKVRPLVAADPDDQRARGRASDGRPAGPGAIQTALAIVSVLLAALAAITAFPTATVWIMSGLVALGTVAGLAPIGLGWAGRQHAHQELHSVQNQLEFAQALVHATNADQVEHLIQRQLARTDSAAGARQSALEYQGIQNCVDMAEPVLATMAALATAEFRAATDSLTGLPNKQVVDDTLELMSAWAARSIEPMAVLLLDLDHFKSINDRFGHPVGDQVLASVGAAIRSALRASDFAGRNGGEEFAVLLPNTDVEGAMRAAEKMRTAIANIRLPGIDLSVTVSVGVAVCPTHAATREQLETLADSALYAAKGSGRNRVELATGR